MTTRAPTRVPKSRSHLADLDLIAVRADSGKVSRSLYELKERPTDEAERQIARALVPLLPKLREQLLLATREATYDDVAKMVALLSGCFPSAESKDLRVFGRFAIGDILALHPAPTVMQLDSAFGKLRASSKWLPAISQILEAIREEDDSRFRLRIIDEFAALTGRLFGTAAEPRE